VQLVIYVPLYQDVYFTSFSSESLIASGLLRRLPPHSRVNECSYHPKQRYWIFGFYRLITIPMDGQYAIVPAAMVHHLPSVEIDDWQI
jgi:hypothetical protein